MSCNLPDQAALVRLGVSGACIQLIGEKMRWNTCEKHGDEKKNVWGCPYCLAELHEENKRLRKIAAHVQANVYIAAKEAAGYGTKIKYD